MMQVAACGLPMPETAGLSCRAANQQYPSQKVRFLLHAHKVT